MTLGLIQFGELSNPADQNKTELVDIGNGNMIEVAPDEVLIKYTLSGVPTVITGTASSLYSNEYGIRTDSFSRLIMRYYPSSGTTTTSTYVPLGDQWQGYKVYTDITQLTENRTWLVNNGFSTTSHWSYETVHREGAFNGNNRIHYFTSTGTHVGMWGTRGTANSQFIDPWGIAFDSSGNLYVCDSYNNRIQVFTSTGDYIRGWGSYGSGNGQFNRPTGIAIDSVGLVYVVDSGNDRIQVFTSTGTYVRQWGTPGSGNGQFHSPTGIAIRRSNNYVYVTDTGNDRVQYFQSSGSYLGAWGTTGTGNGQFSMPTGIAINQADGNVAVADTSNNRLQYFSSTGTFIRAIGSAGTGNGRFYTPTGVAITSTYIYASDMGNHRIQYFRTNNGQYVGQWGSDGSDINNIRFGYGLAISSTGNVYVSEGGGTGFSDANWLADGHGTGDAAPVFQIDGYWHNMDASQYGFWYNPGDKAFVRQVLNIPRGEVTWAGISLDYYGDCRGSSWSSIIAGYFELFVSVGDPDNGGEYLWSKKFGTIADDNVWYSTGLLPVDPSKITLPTLDLMAGLRVTLSEWYRPSDIRPEGRLDNIALYIKAKVLPTDVNLKMNGVAVQNVYSGGNPVYGLGSAEYIPSTPWTSGRVYANFSWTPVPNPPDPNMAIILEFDAAVTAYARRFNVPTISDTGTFAEGDAYEVQNASMVRWTTNHYAAVPGGYANSYFFNTTLPLNRDIDHVGQPNYRYVNLTYGWQLGDPGDGMVNVSAYLVTTTSQNGFWLMKGWSPNMIGDLQVWNPTTSSWTRTRVFRAGESTRFRAVLSSSYQNDVVQFTIYSPNGNVWGTVQGTVDSAGYAVSDYVNFGATNASTGQWEVQAFVLDNVSGGAAHNVGFFRRAFSVQHSTSISVKYPSAGLWSANVTYGQMVLLQFRVTDADNGDLLPGGTMTYSWAAGSGTMGDLGTGEYSVTLDTRLLSSNGPFTVSILWTKNYYDSIARVFTLNVIFTTNLFSPDAPGIDVPSGSDAEFTLRFVDQLNQPITGASIWCNWTLDTYYVTPVQGSPGHYKLRAETDGVPLNTYRLSITASKDYVEPRTIILSLQVRELHTSAIPSTSYLQLPVGYNTNFTITYTDTDHNSPIVGAASAIVCNWSDIHQYGDLNYTVVETTTPGVYRVTLYSKDTDLLRTYSVKFDVLRRGSQNHTFSVTVVLKTHLTSFSLTNPIEPTPYTGNFQILVLYYDADVGAGIENGSRTGYNVKIIVTSVLPSLSYTVKNGTYPGEYIILVPAYQWGSIGEKSLTIYVYWTGPTQKYYNKVIVTSGVVIGTPTDVFLSESPRMTPYDENVTFSLVYYDTAAGIGIVNGTGPYAGNVHIIVEVLTPGHMLDQSRMVITEVDYITSPGVYRITFDTAYLSGLSSCQLKIWFLWTRGQLPLYENRSIIITIYTVQRPTMLEWTPLPVTPFDSLVNLTVIYRDVSTGLPIIPYAHSCDIWISESVIYTVYVNTISGTIYLELDTSSWSPGTHVFHINIYWYGPPYYQNRTGIPVSITVRERNTALTHGSYLPTQYGENVTVIFQYIDLDDFTTSGMSGCILSVDAWLTGHYWVEDLGNGMYRLVLNTSPFGRLGVFAVNVTIQYTGTRHCLDALDVFYLSIVYRGAQLITQQPDLTPYLSFVVINITYFDDITGQGINGANVYVTCANATDPLELDVNYFVDPTGDGHYRIRISSTALGSFGTYRIQIIANYTGAPFYMERVRAVDVIISRRPVSLTVTRSPLNTPYLENVQFTISVTDLLSGTAIEISKMELILKHGTGTVIPDSLYSLTGVPGAYVITFNSTVITSVLVTDYMIYVLYFWGDRAPYYGNASTSTQVTITSRFTQAIVLSTPAADYGLNITMLVKYEDYLTGRGISGATVSLRCTNDSSFTYWIDDLGDGRYRLIVDTSTLLGLGQYLFNLDLQWSGPPYYQSCIDVTLKVSVTVVSTYLSFNIIPGTVFYLGDTIYASIDFRAVASGLGVTGADVTTDWTTLYGTASSITDLGNGTYRLTIQTTGLNAGRYGFHISASKYLHLNRTISAEVILAALPVSIILTFLPITPEWGDTIHMTVNVTSLRTRLPVTGASVNLTIGGVVYVLEEMGSGLYNCTVSTSNLTSGEYIVTVFFMKQNFETREVDFQLRISKLTATLTAVLSPNIAVDGQDVIIRAYYRVNSTNAPIESGTVSFSWIGGTGLLYWNPTNSCYVGVMPVQKIPVGTYYVLIQASSANYKSVSIILTIEIRPINAKLTIYGGTTYFSVISGDILNITIYLNSTELNRPILGGYLFYSVANLTGDMIELGNGYYMALIDTDTLEIRQWTVLITAITPGYLPASAIVTMSVQIIPTRVLVVGEAQQTVIYGQNATFRFILWDDHNGVAVPGSETLFNIEQSAGSLIDMGNGTYLLILNSTVAAAGPIAHDVSISFVKYRYQSQYTIVKLLVRPIPTTVIGNLEVELPVTDDYSQCFTFVDTLRGHLIGDATASAIWAFGTTDLYSFGNGTYRFGPAETNISRLEVRSEPYVIRLIFSRGNYSKADVTLLLTIRLVKTEIQVAPMPSQFFVGQPFTVRVTYWDLDHNVPIPHAINATPALQLTRVPSLDVDFGNGTYVLGFLGPGLQMYSITIQLTRDDYATAETVVVIFTILTEEQMNMARTFAIGAILFAVAAGAGAAYIRVWSVPKLLRYLRRMVSQIERGLVPAPAPVRDRRRAILDMMNEELAPLKIVKTYDDLSESTLVVSTLDLEALLTELATLVGLTEADMRVLRADLDKMRPSERAGFVSEVLKQERARRAREIAVVSAEEEAKIAASRAPTEEELRLFRERLQAMGIAESEIELMVEQAKSLTKAEIDALLDQLGGDKE